MDTIDLLLNADTQKMPEKNVKIKRLSRECGGDVVFTLKGLGYSRVAELRKYHSEDMDIHIILAGVVAPDLKSAALADKYKASTPAELIKNMLLPGEIDDLSREIEKLSGYRGNTFEEIKKK